MHSVGAVFWAFIDYSVAFSEFHIMIPTTTDVDMMGGVAQRIRHLYRADDWSHDRHWLCPILILYYIAMWHDDSPKGHTVGAISG